MNYLDKDEISTINEVVVQESGGSIGVREVGLLDSIANKPASGFGDHESYPGIYLKAAVLYEAIVNYHVFVDGNKRTGFATMARFLAINGYDIVISNREIVDFTIRIATAKPDLSDIAAWIEKHAKKVKI